MTDRVARMWTAGRCGWAGPGRGDGCDGGRDADGWVGGRVEGEVGGGVWAGGWSLCAAGTRSRVVGACAAARRGSCAVQSLVFVCADPLLALRAVPRWGPVRSVLARELRLGEVEDELGLEVLWGLDDLDWFPLRARRDGRERVGDAGERPQWPRLGQRQGGEGEVAFRLWPHERHGCCCCCLCAVEDGLAGKRGGDGRAGCECGGWIKTNKCELGLFLRVNSAEVRTHYCSRVVG